MSEKLCRLLLRAYPSRFRRQYGEETMQLFRDRLRDERGAVRRARLWLDLLRDLIASAPREHTRASAHATRPARAVGGVPSFLLLEEQPLRPDMFALGTLLALLAVGTFGYLLTHGGNRVVFPAIANPLYRARGLAAAPNSAQQHSTPSAQEEEAPVPVVSPAERQRVLSRVIDAVRRYDPAEAPSVATWLDQRERLGEYNGILKGPDFAAVLTREVNEVTRRISVTVLCGQQPLPGSAIWVAPSHPGQRAWLRIDDRFSLVLEPVKPGAGNVDRLSNPQSGGGPGIGPGPLRISS
jgi:hypothetical protein